MRGDHYPPCRAVRAGAPCRAERAGRGLIIVFQGVAGVTGSARPIFTSGSGREVAGKLIWLARWQGQGHNRSCGRGAVLLPPSSLPPAVLVISQPQEGGWGSQGALSPPSWLGGAREPSLLAW